MANAVTEWVNPIAEGSAATYKAQLIDGLTEAGVPPADISAAIATLTVGRAGGVTINGRNAQNIHNANNGSFAADGWFTFIIQPADTVAIGTTKIQRRWLTFTITYAGGVITHKIVFYVYNLSHVADSA